MKNRIILCDIDGVALDWEWAFHIWMEEQGFQKQEGGQFVYNIGKRYGIDSAQGQKLIKLFNESAAIGFLPALRDAQQYVKKLHQEHDFMFHCITSLSRNENAQKLRVMNLQKLFGKSCFERFVFLDTGADKDAALAEYQDSGCWWIEDKWLNCLAGLKAGLKPILVEHGHSIDFVHPDIHKVKNWAEIYKIILAGV
jgi:beta-phosphoglucomutase-like phosphatase (HAD superfamily)